jgi:hypothetical protein
MKPKLFLLKPDFTDPNINSDTIKYLTLRSIVKNEYIWEVKSQVANVSGNGYENGIVGFV